VGYERPHLGYGWRRFGVAAITRHLEPERVHQPILEPHRCVDISITYDRNPRLRRRGSTISVQDLSVEPDERHAFLKP
jgi:hypothetical protein